MFARVTTFRGGAARLAEGTELFREQVVPEDEKQPGFAGALLLADRDAELSYAVTFWDSEEAMVATDELGKQLAEAAARELELSAEIGHFEVLFSKLPAVVA